MLKTRALNAIADFNNKPGNYNCLEYSANYSDWRLPNVKELESLINYGDLDSAARLNSEGFVDVKSSYYWSSTTYPSNALQAWVINMTKGDMIPAIKNYNYYIFPVRPGNVVELPPPGIIVTVPSGGENWQAGITQTIRWTYTGSPDMYVKIELYKGGVLNQTITSNAWIGDGGSGYYNWMIPSTQFQGSDYTIKVTSTNSSYSDMSDNPFTIQGPPPPEITVTRPIGGETWVAGSRERIRWTYKGDPGSYVVIELLQGGGDNVVKTLTSYARTTTGYYDWRIPSNQTFGNDYRIRVKSRSYSNVYSASDYFTIKSQ
jgi:hypothetical protein